MHAWGEILHSCFQVTPRLEPLPLGTHHWWMVGHICPLGIQGTHSSKPHPGHMTSHWVKKHPSMCALLLPLRKSDFYFIFIFWSSHTHWCLLIALPSPLLDWKWSKQGTKRKLMFILSRKAGLLNWEKETPEGNHDSLPSLVSVSIIPLRFNMHSDYFY